MHPEKLNALRVMFIEELDTMAAAIPTDNPKKLLVLRKSAKQIKMLATLLAAQKYEMIVVHELPIEPKKKGL